jgi:hypothetical protein
MVEGILFLAFNFLQDVGNNFRFLGKNNKRQHSLANKLKKIHKHPFNQLAIIFQEEAHGNNNKSEIGILRYKIGNGVFAEVGTGFFDHASGGAKVDDLTVLFVVGFHGLGEDEYADGGVLGGG